jgi:hypothetical protein
MYTEKEIKKEERAKDALKKVYFVASDLILEYLI